MRVNTVIGLVGNRGTGKTDFLKQLVRASSQPKKLIVDTFANPAWANMETWDNPQGVKEPIYELQPENLKHWKNGTYLMFDNDTDALLETIEDNLKNSLVIFEDATKYVGSTLKKELKRFLLDTKQKNIDLIFVFHSLKDLPRDLIRVMDYLILGKTGDKYGPSLRNKYPDEVETAHKKVMSSVNKYEKITLQISS